MTWHHGQWYRVVAAPSVPVGSTHASGAHVNDGTVQGTARLREVHQVDRTADRLIEECSHQADYATAAWPKRLTSSHVTVRLIGGRFVHILTSFQSLRMETRVIGAES